ARAGDRRAPAARRARSARGRAVLRTRLFGPGPESFECTRQAALSARNKFGIILGILLVLAGAYYFFFLPHSSDLVLIGTVDANQVVVSAKIPGRVERLAVDEGTPVKTGDLIAELDTAELN